MTLNDTCANCGQDSANAAQLWDGRCYCLKCLGGPCSSLAHRSREKALESTIHREDGRSARMAFWILVSVLTAAAWINIYLISHKISDIAICPVSFLIIFVAMAMSWPGGSRVRISNGLVSQVSQDRLSRAQFRECHLAGCRWYVGKLKDDDAWRNKLVRNVPALIIIMLINGRTARIACTTDCDGMAVWEQFLRLAAIPEDRGFVHGVRTFVHRNLR